MNLRVIDDFCSKVECYDAVREWPDDSAPWVVYDTDEQKKKAMHDWKSIPYSSAFLLKRMMMFDAPGALGLGRAIPDTMLWGGGLHEHKNGDRLGLHLDSSQHPLTYMKRMCNAILYLSEWNPKWGGGLEFWSGDSADQIVYPKPGRLVVFETCEDGLHGITKPISCYGDKKRLSLAVYWFGEGHNSGRTKAKFM
jgi:Rps23 Pro-64 3,4-dihydroxylase Tpa1-like proline 4-hydroxylase